MGNLQLGSSLKLTPTWLPLHLLLLRPHAAGSRPARRPCRSACSRRADRTVEPHHCRSDCNLGKSDRPLGDVMPPVRADQAEELREKQAEELREKVEQMRAYREWRAEFEAELGFELNKIYQAWIDEFGGYYDEKKGQYNADLGFPTERSLLEQLETTSTSVILDAIRATSRRYHAFALICRDQR
jgi:hypothetical protein